MPSEEEPAVFPATVGPYEAPCPVCEGKTVRHAQTLRRFRHGYAWHVGLIWIELQVPRHRCIECDLTFTHDFGLDLIQSSSALFRKELVQRCHGRSLADVSREYNLPYTTVERWFYTYAPEQIQEEKASRICVDDFALQKGQTYAISVLNTDTDHVLAAGPGRNAEAIQAVLKKVHGVIKEAVSDFAPAMAKAIQVVCPTALHIMDRFHLVQFFTDAMRRRRRYLNEAKKHHTARFMDRCLARKLEDLTEKERRFVALWLQEDAALKHLYQALNHMRYVLKAMTPAQADRRLEGWWFIRYQFHSCGAVSAIAKTVLTRKKEMLQTITSPLSNGIMEGTNNKIKLIKRRGFGYRNDDHFFLRIRLETGR